MFARTFFVLSATVCMGLVSASVSEAASFLRPPGQTSPNAIIFAVDCLVHPTRRVGQKVVTEVKLAVHNIGNVTISAGSKVRIEADTGPLSMFPTTLPSDIQPGGELIIFTVSGPSQQMPKSCTAKLV